MADEGVAVSATALTKRFGDFVAVDRLTFQVGRGEIFGFLGPNGSGKTTTIRMLCGILPPSSGAGRVLGRDIAREAEAVKSSIGYMSQRFSLYEDLTVTENLTFYAGLYGVSGAQQRDRVRRLVEMAGLVGREGELVQNLAGGWRQRLALGCAIVHRPPLLFLDEPTAGVDPASRRQFWDMIYELAEAGTTVFVTTHYMDEAEHCHRVGLMHGGRLIACDTPARVRETSLRGDLWELDCEPAVEAAEALRGEPGVLEAALYGLVLHVEVAAGQGVEPLAQALQRRGIATRRLRRIKPSLEDAFVSLVAQARNGGERSVQ